MGDLILLQANNKDADQSMNHRLFDLILTVPIKKFQLFQDGSSCVESVLSNDLAQEQGSDRGEA